MIDDKTDDLAQHAKEAKLMMRLSTIPRWNIIEMIRIQSVAEHSFNVWVLVRSLYTYMEDTGHNVYDKEVVQWWALVHDMDEIFTGDMPSTVKEILNRQHPGITTQLKEEVLQHVLPDVCSTIRGIKNSFPYAIVQLCDMLEALLFVQVYAVRESDKQEVFEFILPKLRKAYEEARGKYHTKEWPRATAWLNSMVPGVILPPQ